MKYTICSLAVGEKYFSTIYKTFNDISARTNHGTFLIATDIKLENPNDKIKLVDVSDKALKTRDHRWFNYNLKYFPVQESSKLDTEFIMFIDADWGMLDSFNEEHLMRLFSYMQEHNIDFVYERPHPIGPQSKKMGRECFWWHKIEPYGLDKTDKYDNGQVCNEQCFVFRNNEKMKPFCDSWEALNDKCHSLNIWPFAEGVEIGMSTIEANMKCDWWPMRLMGPCFYFYAKDGGYNERFH